MWHNELIDGYDTQIKYYEEGSQFGINGGRISKLWIAKDGVMCALYERGWVQKPKTTDVMVVYENLVSRFN